jgi:hypothetical protein
MVGDISYNSGLHFIRNNIAVRLLINAGYCHLITEIAQFIDLKLMSTQPFSSLEQVMPVINTFGTDEQPVVLGSNTPLVIEVACPANSKLTYSLNDGINFPSFRYDADKYNDAPYLLGQFDGEMGLTLTVTNELGFCADSTITVQVINTQ